MIRGEDLAGGAAADQPRPAFAGLFDRPVQVLACDGFQQYVVTLDSFDRTLVRLGNEIQLQPGTAFAAVCIALIWKSSSGSPPDVGTET